MVDYSHKGCTYFLLLTPQAAVELAGAASDFCSEAHDAVWLLGPFKML